MIEAEGSRYPEAPIREYFRDDHANWREAHADDPANAGVFRLPLAPDALHKANVSGGPPAGMRLPWIRPCSTTLRAPGPSAR